MAYEIYDHNSLKAAVEKTCAFLASHAVSEEKVFDCKLVAYELLANTLEHSGGKAWLQVVIEGDKIHVIVRAERTYCPPQRGACPSQEAERGRGLYLVDKLSEARVFTENSEIKKPPVNIMVG